jgi:hypothetical protein
VEQANAVQQVRDRKWQTEIESVRHERDDLNQRLILEKTRLQSVEQRWQVCL